MEIDEMLDLISEAPVDTGKRGGGMTVKKSDWESIHETLIEKGHGVKLDFNVVRQLVGSDSSSPNNFVYQLNRQFKKLGLKLHAGQRSEKNEDGEDVVRIAINIRE